MARHCNEMTEADDLNLDELRLKLAPYIASSAIFDGWSADAVAAGAEQAGIDADVAAYAFKGGAMDMIAAWIGHVDVLMEEAFQKTELADLPVRERIRRLIVFRLGRVEGIEEALRRALAIMAMPQNAGRALKLGWRSADRIWRLAGDTAVDYNHYTKRAILAGVYGATLTVFANDTSEEKIETMRFLDRRIDGIIRFEKAKGRLFPPNAERFSPTRFMGRLRYPLR